MKALIYLPFFGAVVCLLVIGFVWIYMICVITDIVSDWVLDKYQSLKVRLNARSQRRSS